MDFACKNKKFKETTSGHLVIMGQKTFESFGNRPLPNRRNIVLTKDASFVHEGIEIVHLLEELDNLLKKENDESIRLAQDKEVFIIGGGQIYKLFMEKADKLYITHVNGEFLDADTFFPKIDQNIWEKKKIRKYPKDDLNKYDLEFVEYKRIR